MSLTIRVLLGLLLGVAVGAGVAASRHPVALASIPVIEAVGTLWLNALRMTVIPLIMSLLILGVSAASETAAAGRIGRRTLAVIAVMLTAAAAFTALAAPLLLAWIPVNTATAAALRSTLQGVEEAAVKVPGLAEWITGLVPANPIEAAASSAMLPLVVFSIFLGFAATRISAGLREHLLSLFRAIAEAMMQIVNWVMRAAPIGVFALAFPFGAGAGLGVIGALGHYVLLTSGLCVVATLVLYPVTALLTGVRVRRFASAIAAAQAVAFSTRSSLASLPAMLESAQRRMRLPVEVSGLVLPLAVSLMRISMPITNLGGAIFAAALLGIALTPGQIAVGAVVALMTSIGGVGLPGQAAFMATVAPIFLAMGIPLEMLALLLAVETIPDAFATVANVTADLAAAAIVACDGGALPTAPA